MLADGRFLPGGRILAGAGTGRRLTLFNCFVLGTIGDSLDGIFGALHEGALTMQEGGGVGYDFSTLRPRGMRARATGGVASGPVSFMGLWDRMCETLETANNRRGAMMATLRCDHPDVIEFVEAKRAGKTLSNFNLSVQITDEFLQAVREDREHLLVFPEAGLAGVAGRDPNAGERVMRTWTGQSKPVPCRVLARVPARELWQRLLGSAAASGEPGFLFVDRINRDNNLWYRERITATNPCGEEPLPPYGACNLGSLNLAAFVTDPYSDRAALQLDRLAATTALAVRFLDDVIDVSRFPLPGPGGGRPQHPAGRAGTDRPGRCAGAAGSALWQRGRAGPGRTGGGHRRPGGVSNVDRPGPGQGPLPGVRAGSLPGGAIREPAAARSCARASPGTASATAICWPSPRLAASACWPATCRAVSSRFSARATAGR